MAHRVGVLLYDGVQLLDFAGPADVFGAAARLLSEEGRGAAYEVVTLSDKGRPVRTMSGVTIAASTSWGRVQGLDTLVVPGGFGLDGVLEDLARWVRERADRIGRFVSVCNGGFVLAEAGLLDGRRATTHWAACQEMAQRYPAVTVDPVPVFVREGAVLTSAGCTSGVDVALHLVGDDFGRETARELARWFVVYVQRAGSQPQLSFHLRHQLAHHDPIARLQTWLLSNLAADLSVAELARRAHMSQRHFIRSFTQEVGLSPGRYVRRLRLEAAQRLLEEGRESVDHIAAKAGFGSADVMRRMFVRELDISPSTYRARFHCPPPDEE